MIHNSSTDDVLIKKISLIVWSLRDEIESRIQQRIARGELNPEDKVEFEKQIQEMRSQYSKSQTKNEKTNSSDQVSPNEATAPHELSDKELDSLAMADDVSMNLNSDTDLNFIPEDKVAFGKTILSEISMDKILFFCNHSFIEGQSVVIKFNIPQAFVVNADIKYCRPFNFKSRIISKNNYNFRVLADFTFLKPGERALLRQFIQSIDARESSPKLELVPGHSQE